MGQDGPHDFTKPGRLRSCRPRRDGVRPHVRGRAQRRPDPRCQRGGGARLLHQTLRGARSRGHPAGAADRLGSPVARRGPAEHQPGEEEPVRRERRRRSGRAEHPARGSRPRAGAGERGPQSRAGPAGRGHPGDQGGHGRRSRAARPEQRLARRGEPVPVAAGPVEGAPPDRPGHRRRAVAPLLDGADHLHPSTQGAVRRAGRAPGGGPGDQGADHRRGARPGRLDRVGSDSGCVPRPDGPVEGGRCRAA